MSQRNVTRALRRAQTKARNQDGSPTFPELQNGAKVTRNTVPSFHGFRHSVASEGISAGDKLAEISWQLGHTNTVTTASVYTQEVKNAERSAARRAAMEERWIEPAEVPEAAEGDVVELTDRRAS